MSNKLNKRNQGFTIIEVLIVLAIAGIIMLIVFLAVPALQRNSRNTQRRTDVANYLSAVAEWQANNAGKVPTAAADLTGANGVNSLAKLGFYNPAPTTVVTGAQATALNVDTLQYVQGAQCSTVTVGQTVAGTPKQVAARFAVEGSAGAAIAQCQDS
jgi:prepilin-type N-terminal cleavage/methylation domain-containing protein